MSLMISPGMRGADGAATLAGATSAGPGAASPGRGRGTTAGVPLVTTTGVAPSALFDIGARGEPDCMNSTLIRIAIAAKVPTMKPMASRGLHPITRNGYQ